MDIQCQLKNAQLIKLLITKIRITKFTPSVKFIPQRFFQLTSPKEYRKVLLAHNKKLNNHQVITIYNLTDKKAKQTNKNNTKVIQEL